MAGFEPADVLTVEEFFALDVDVLVPAALEAQIAALGLVPGQEDGPRGHGGLGRHDRHPDELPGVARAVDGGQEPFGAELGILDLLDIHGRQPVERTDGADIALLSVGLDYGL